MAPRRARAKSTKTGKALQTVHRAYTLDEFIRIAVQHGPRVGADLNVSWSGGTFSEAIAMAKAGYKPENPTIDEIVESIETSLDSSMMTTFESFMDVTGDAVDVGRFLTGEPECMMTSLPIRVMRTGRVIRVAVPVAQSAATDEDTYLRRGAAVMALLEILGQLQIPMEIYAVMAMHSRDNRESRLDYAVKIVGAGEVLDHGRAAYALCHRSFFRQIGFSVMDSEPDEIGYHFGANGAYYGVPSWGAELADLEINDENAIVLPEVSMGDRWHVNTCVEWVREQVARIQAMQV
jgi:hypothetical protein